MSKKSSWRKKEKVPYIFQVSTKPDKSSYKWIGKELSLFSTASLWFVWFCRVLSIYQNVKAIVRIVGEKINSNSTDNKSGRPNIPPKLGELYFLVWTVLFSFAHYFGWQSGILRIAMIYYLFESSVWIFYYTIFRRFFELGYTIYHKLEYLTQMFLVIPTQALCAADLYGKSFREILLALLGSAQDDTPFSIALLGSLFSIIVISMIISSFPVENIKAPDWTADMFVIGCGDVVKNRLYPALRKCRISDDVEVYDFKSVKEEEREQYCTYLANQEEICDDIDKKLTSKDIVWIETPPFAHLSYLEHYINSNARLIVLEKPISNDRQELARVSKLINRAKYRNKIFFLSYYTLEKALPLHYIANPNSFYKKYLNIANSELLWNLENKLGKLKSAKVHICEGLDERDWVYDENNGGQLIETFLHNVLIAALVCGDPKKWTDIAYKETAKDEKVGEIELLAKAMDADIHLYLKKNAQTNELSRKAEFIFEAGKIMADFEEKTAKICFDNHDRDITISVKEDYDYRYGVLVDMVASVVEGEAKPQKIDGLGDQISAINWLLYLKEKNQKNEVN